jgi:amylosucrase
MLLLYGITFSIGGIPLLYSSDEIGKLNDYSYRFDESKKHDDRWVNRIAVNDDDTALALGQTPPSSPAEVASLRVFEGLQKMIEIRKKYSVFGQAPTHILDAANQHCFMFLRENVKGEKLLVICNFSEHEQELQRSLLATVNCTSSVDLLSGEEVTMEAEPLILAPFQQLWLLAR